MSRQTPPFFAIRSEINQRENNEDSFLIFTIAPPFSFPPVPVLAIADGMGGGAHGEDVSREALRKLSLSLFEMLAVEPSLNQLQAAPPPDAAAIARSFREAIAQTNAFVKRMVENNRWGKAGTTVAIAAIIEDVAVVANLGDSPLFHYQARSGNLAQITDDHTLTAALLRSHLITPEMARYHFGRNQLEFYLGCAQLPPELPVHQVAIASGDLLLLCSDGISGSLSCAEIAALLAGDDLDAIASRLIRAARDAGETDNQTLILWRHSGRKIADTLVQSGDTVIQNIDTLKQAIAKSEK